MEYAICWNPSSCVPLFIVLACRKSSKFIDWGLHIGSLVRSRLAGSDKLVSEAYRSCDKLPSVSFPTQICGDDSSSYGTVVGFSRKIPPSSPFSQRRGVRSTAAQVAVTSPWRGRWRWRHRSGADRAKQHGFQGKTGPGSKIPVLLSIRASWRRAFASVDWRR
jgi:hypothetical protein